MNSRKIEQPRYRSFTSPAQIQAFTDAFFDRLRWEEGNATEQHIAEPRVGKDTVRPPSSRPARRIGF